MPALSSAERQAITDEIQRAFSRLRDELPPATKAELRSLVNLVDGQLDTAETAILSAINGANPAAGAWFTSNTTLGRRIIEHVQTARRENI